MIDSPSVDTPRLGRAIRFLVFGISVFIYIAMAPIYALNSVFWLFRAPVFSVVILAGRESYPKIGPQLRSIFTMWRDLMRNAFDGLSTTSTNIEIEKRDSPKIKYVLWGFLTYVLCILSIYTITDIYDINSFLSFTMLAVVFAFINVISPAFLGISIIFGQILWGILGVFILIGSMLVYIGQVAHATVSAIFGGPSVDTVLAAWSEHKRYIQGFEKIKNADKSKDYDDNDFAAFKKGLAVIAVHMAITFAILLFAFYRTFVAIAVYILNTLVAGILALLHSIKMGVLNFFGLKSLSPLEYVDGGNWTGLAVGSLAVLAIAALIYVVSLVLKEIQNHKNKELSEDAANVPK